MFFIHMQKQMHKTNRNTISPRIIKVIKDHGTRTRMTMRNHRKLVVVFADVVILTHDEGIHSWFIT